MKEVLVEKFDGAVMSAIVGDRVTLDENKAIQLVAYITERNASASAKSDRAAVLADELGKLTDEIASAAPVLEADTAEAKSLILHFVKLYRENSRAVPAQLSAFVADLETPAADTDNATPDDTVAG
jgi:hypothetical protein